MGEGLGLLFELLDESIAGILVGVITGVEDGVGRRDDASGLGPGEALFWGMAAALGPAVLGGFAATSFGLARIGSRVLKARLQEMERDWDEREQEGRKGHSSEPTHARRGSRVDAEAWQETTSPMTVRDANRMNEFSRRALYAVNDTGLWSCCKCRGGNATKWRRGWWRERVREKAGEKALGVTLR